MIENDENSMEQPDYDYFRRFTEHEDNLINHRFSWFILAQSFLLAAWFYVPDHPDKIIAIAGLASSVLPYISIIAAVVALHKVRKQVEELKVEYEGKNESKKMWKNHPPLTSKGKVYFFGLAGAIGTPVVFIIIWIHLLC